MMLFFHCKKAEILSEDGTPAAEAVVSIAATGGLLLTLPRDFTVELNAPVFIVFYDPIIGMVRCRCTLSSPLISDDHQACSYRCTVLERLHQEQRREDIKIPVSAKVTVTLKDPENPQEAPADLYNISAGGVYLLTTLQAKAGDLLSFLFRGPFGSIPLTARILRAEDRRDRYNRPIRGYGCRFVGLSTYQESQLRSFVFREEKRLYKEE